MGGYGSGRRKPAGDSELVPASEGVRGIKASGENDPYPGVTDRTKRRFLEALRAEGSIRAGARAVHLPHSTLYRWRDNDPAFADAWRIAEEEVTLELEDKLTSLAKGGQESTKSQLTALIFALKARRPQVYRDTTAAPASGPVVVVFKDFVVEQAPKLGE